LGHGGSDAKLAPEQIKLGLSSSKPIPFSGIFEQDLQIVKVIMAKYHVMILTQFHLLTYGFGTGGRLGHGNEDTVFKPQIVKGLPGEVLLIAAGSDHSLAFTSDGTLWSWGSNGHHQLGYTVDGNKQLTPREVITKKHEIKGMAASKYHSVYYTNNGSIYTWGTNNGQLGYSQAVQIYPRKITSFAQQNILELEVTNFSTGVLVEHFQVYVFAGGVCQKIRFPSIPAPIINRRLSGIRSEYPCHIRASNHEIACVYSNGDVFMWCPEPNASTISKFTNSPQLVWKHRKPREKVQDCAIGVDGSIIVQTESGHVFVGARKGQHRNSQDIVKYKFQKIANLEHISSVTASSSGSFGAVRSDYRFLQSIKSGDYLTTSLEGLYESERTDFDFRFVLDREITISAHRCILSHRSPFIHRCLHQNQSQDGTEYSFESRNGSSILHLPSIHKSSLLLVLEMIYTGKFTKPWDNFSLYSGGQSQSHPEVKIHADFRKLIKLFELDETEVVKSSFRDSTPLINLRHMNASFCNVKVVLKDMTLLCHSVILSCRCPFFSAILGSASRWTLQSNEDGIPMVSLPHIEGTVFQALVRWMESDSVEYMFDIPEAYEVSNWLSLVQGVLIAANELLLPIVVSITSAILSRMITITNAIEFLNLAIINEANQLKEACLDFIIRNAETYLNLNQLISQPSYVLQEIEFKLRELQIAKLPFMLGPDGYYAQVRRMGVDESQLPPISSISSVSAELVSQSQSRSPSIRRVNSFSPLLMPMNIQLSGSPVTIMSSRSFEDFSLNSSLENQAWIEARGRYCFA
jgi:hypothetical protein